jgi:hypothetical protein
MAGLELVAAKDINEGDCFRKLTGEYVYVRISPSSVNFFGLPPDQVYGVCHNGNMCAVPQTKMVVACSPRDFLQGYANKAEWERSVGVVSRAKNERCSTCGERYDSHDHLIECESDTAGD